MKKTLVALAVLATAGTAFAQNTISLTGNFGVAAQRTQVGKPHLAITDGSIKFAGSEDLGSGLKAGFSLGSDFFRFSDKAGGSGTTLGATADVFGTLSGGFGVLKGGQWEACQAMLNGNVSGVSLDTGIDNGAVVKNCGRTMRLAYSTSFSGVGLSLTASQRSAAGGSGGGATGPLVDQNKPSLTPTIQYTAGGLNLGYSPSSVNIDNGMAHRLWAKYDFGGFKIGGGYEKHDQNDGQSMLVSAAVPVGPVTLSALFGQSEDLAVVGAKANFWGAAAEYALSKRTNVNLSLGKHDGDAGYNVNQGQGRLRVLHNF